MGWAPHGSVLRRPAGEGFTRRREEREEGRGRFQLLQSTEAAGQAEGVADDDEVAEAHGGGAEGGMDESDGGEGHGGGVVEEGPEEVLTDGPQGGGGELQGVGHTSEIGSQQDDSSSFTRYVRGSRDGNPQIGSGQCRAVVDAIADERDLTTGGAELSEGVGLAFGTDAGMDEFGIDAGLAGDGLGGEGMIAGKHSNLITGLTETLDGVVCLGAEGVAQGEGAPELGSGGEDERGGTLGEPGVEEGLCGGEIDTGAGGGGE